VVEGDINYQSLSVSRGARMNGNCQFSESELDITVLSGKKDKSAGALAFGDAAMDAVSDSQKETGASKTTASAARTAAKTSA
jgi:hypothetical protein